MIIKINNENITRVSFEDSFGLSVTTIDDNNKAFMRIMLQCFVGDLRYNVLSCTVCQEEKNSQEDIKMICDLLSLVAELSVNAVYKEIIANHNNFDLVACVDNYIKSKILPTDAETLEKWFSFDKTIKLKLLEIGYDYNSELTDHKNFAYIDPKLQNKMHS